MHTTTRTFPPLGDVSPSRKQLAGTEIAVLSDAERAEQIRACAGDATVGPWGFGPSHIPCHSLPDDLKRARIAQKLSLEEVAARMGVSVEFVTHIEGSQGADMRLTTLRRYLMAIGAALTFTISNQYDASARAASRPALNAHVHTS